MFSWRIERQVSLPASPVYEYAEVATQEELV